MNLLENWDSDRSALLNALRGSDHGHVAGLLDRAAASASAGNLSEAARWLEEIRQALVGRNLFGSWDNGIWVFSSIIRMVREMSPDSSVPSEFQRFLDAIPSARMDAVMTKQQKAFWYGGHGAEIYGEIRATGGASSSGIAIVWCIVVAVVLAVLVRLFLIG